MSKAEAEYRAYLIGSDGHFASFRSLVCDNDADAIAWAKQLTGDQEIELWNGKRLVGRLPAQPRST
jgi:hypothetical protein